MLKVAIATDTTSEISKEIANKYNIRLVPLYIHIDGKSLLENEIDLDWFCEQLPRWKQENRVITSSAPSVGDFLDAFRELSSQAEAVLAVCLSSKFSATFGAALEAKKLASAEMPDVTFELFDTLTVCGAQMLVALESARAATAGRSLDEVVQRADYITERVNYISLSSDVSNLAKCGRIHQARSLAASKVANTVLMEATMATGGEHKALGRYSTRKKALERIIEIIKERGGDRRLHVVINHADALAEAEELRDRILAEFRCREIFICQSLAVVTYHEGLGNLKCSWWSED
jgi:DegV family protein with EDD domain